MSLPPGILGVEVDALKIVVGVALGFRAGGFFFFHQRPPPDRWLKTALSKIICSALNAGP